MVTAEGEGLRTPGHEMFRLGLDRLDGLFDAVGADAEVTGVDDLLVPERVGIVELVVWISRMCAGPKRAPGRKLVPESKGMPTTARAACSTSSIRGQQRECRDARVSGKVGLVALRRRR